MAECWASQELFESVRRLTLRSLGSEHNILVGTIDISVTFNRSVVEQQGSGGEPGQNEDASSAGVFQTVRHGMAVIPSPNQRVITQKHHPHRGHVIWIQCGCTT